MPDGISKEMARTDPRMGATYLKEQFPETRKLEDLPFLQRTMGRIMEWAEPRKAMKERTQYYGEKLADPVEAALTFGPMPLITKPEFMAGVRATAAKKASLKGRGAVGLSRRLTKEAPDALFDYIDALKTSKGRLVHPIGTPAAWVPAARRMEFASFPRAETPLHEVGHAIVDLLLGKAKPGSALARTMGKVRMADPVRRRAIHQLQSTLGKGGLLTDVEIKAVRSMVKSGYKTIPNELFADTFAREFARGASFRDAVKTASQSVRKNFGLTERVGAKVVKSTGRLKMMKAERERLRKQRIQMEQETRKIPRLLASRGLYPGKEEAISWMVKHPKSRIDFPGLMSYEKRARMGGLDEDALSAMWYKYMGGGK